MTDGDGRPTGAVSGQTELKQLHRHRVALERAVQVARAVEQLHRGLQSALLMENPPKSVAAKARGFLRQIDQATLAQPLGELQRTVARLDTEVQAGLDDVMAYADPGCERLALLTDEPAAADMDEVESLLARLSRFRRQAQTAVALRLLLKERGADVQPVVLAIPTAVIEAGVEAVRQRESVCRNRVRAELTAFRETVTRLQAADNLPESMQTVLSEVSVALSTGLRHLERGGILAELPVNLEVIELAEDPPAAKHLPREEPTRPEDRPRQRRPGLLSRLWRFLTSPLGQLWRDSRQGNAE